MSRRYLKVFIFNHKAVELASMFLLQSSHACSLVPRRRRGLGTRLTCLENSNYNGYIKLVMSNTVVDLSLKTLQLINIYGVALHH